jgi:hypothetical protein
VRAASAAPSVIDATSSAAVLWTRTMIAIEPPFR